MPNPPTQDIRAATKYLVIAAALAVFIGWLLNTPAGFFGKFDAIGYAVCHRISDRSYHVGGYQLPLCVRCSGMYLGAVTGLIFQAIVGWKRNKIPHWSILSLLVLFVIAFGIDGSNSYLYLLKQVSPGILPNLHNLYTPNSTLRLVTGSGMGLAMAVMLFPAFNQTIWADGQDKAALSGWKSFGLLLLLQALIIGLVLTEIPAVLYPVAVISALGVWFLLSIVYSMLWVMVMGQDNTFTSLKQMALPLLAGLTVAMIQTAAIDILRYWLTGTWGSFPLR